jgi:hypothetical protein
VNAFNQEIIAPRRHNFRSPETSVLAYLEALTFDFERDEQQVSAVLIYAEPDPDASGAYRLVAAADQGFEGIACVDDTARAINLALQVYERNRSRTALALAKSWLTFLAYMQYPDGEFANFIRNGAGVRNATGATSVKGGHWWTVRALRALARAYRVTGNSAYLAQFQRCPVHLPDDCKLRAVMALAEIELYQVTGEDALKRSILNHCDLIVSSAADGYFRDQPDTNVVHMWGYHQLHAVASAACLLNEPSLLGPCRKTVQTLVEPDIRDCFWHSYPAKQKDGVCAYDVAPLVQGLSVMHRITGARRYRDLALRASAWFYGRNDAGTVMYDPDTGRCRDGITAGVASLNYGAESAIEAGFAEMERRDLLSTP